MARGQARRGPLLIAFGGALFGSAGHALALEAPPPERIRTLYAAPPGCPSEADFAGELRKRTRRPWVAAGPSSERTFRVAVTSSGGAFRGRLVTESPSGAKRSDEVVGDKCEDVVSALAVKTGLTIDGGPPQPLPPVFPLKLQSPAREDPRLMHPPAFIRLDARDLPWRFTIGAQVTALGGVAPGVAAAGSLFADLSRIGEGEDAATIRISVMRAQTYLLTNQEIVTIKLVASRLEGCPLHRRFGALTFAPCFAVDTGVVEWEADPPSAIRQWLAASVIGRAQLTLFGRLVLEGQIAAVVPIIRDRFGFGDDEVNGRAVHEVPVLTGSASAGVGVRFP
jgi:hypothetical protein